jgi:hypothetical protein
LIINNEDMTVVIHAGQLRLPLIAVRPDQELRQEAGNHLVELPYI